jgi:non-lysosomal glucosylceramidase
MTDAWRRAAWSVACDAEFAPAEPDHDKLEILDPPYHGAPVGGFGAGTFARTYRGDAARWHLRPARHHYRSLPACSALLSLKSETRSESFAIGPKPTDGSLRAWSFRTADIQYDALYPLSAYQGRIGNEVTFEWTQFSPIWPHNYRELSFPVAVNEWRFTNHGTTPATVSVALSWENVSFVAPGDVPTFTPRHVAGDHWLRMGRDGTSPEEAGAFALAVDGGSPFVVPAFDAAGDGEAAWSVLEDASATAADPVTARSAERTAGLLGSRVTLAPGEAATVTITHAWHIPTFGFGSGRRWTRPYTKIYGTDIITDERDAKDGAAVRLALDALAERDRWRGAIDAWQRPYLERRVPALTRGLFNSLYVLADASTWGLAPLPNDDTALQPVPDVPGARDIGRFAVLECFTYPYLSTLDVRYYGTFPLLYHWPELERQVLLQYAESANRTDEEERDMLHVVERATRKVAGTLPHDLGNPDEDPWVKVNAYDDIDPNRWKDLGPKFILQVDRYMCAVDWEDRGFLHGAWPAVKSALDHMSSQDTDGDGLPENEGIPDQTFDKWPMTGPSAYCSILAVAALHAGERIARWCGDPGAARGFAAWRRKATAQLHERLWTGTHFAYDTAPGSADLVMSGQLSGAWSLELTGSASGIDPERIRQTLDTIWDTCRIEIEGEPGGLQNGAALPGTPKPDNRHAREVWTGITYGVASHYILHGRSERGLSLVAALDRMIHVTRPFAFWIPEAWDEQGRFRGAMYHRPCSIWSVEEALRRTEADPAMPPFGGERPEES